MHDSIVSARLLYQTGEIEVTVLIGRKGSSAYFVLAHLTAPTRTAANCFGRSMCP